VELFADLSNKVRQKARQRHPAKVLADNFAADDKKKKNSHRPRNARKKQTSLAQEQQTRKLPSFSEFDNYSLCIEDKKNDDNARLRLEDSIDEQRINSFVEMVKQVARKQHESECQPHSVRCSSSSWQSDVMSRIPAGLVTSTPHQLSVGRPSSQYSKLSAIVDSTSQLQLFDASIDAEIGTYCCFVDMLLVTRKSFVLLFIKLGVR